MIQIAVLSLDSRFRFQNRIGNKIIIPEVSLTQRSFLPCDCLLKVWHALRDILGRLYLLRFVIWGVMSCSPVEMSWLFGGTYQSESKTVNLCMTTRCHIAENSTLCSHMCENNSSTDFAFHSCFKDPTVERDMSVWLELLIIDPCLKFSCVLMIAGRTMMPTDW
jgi:hypothetical protein